MKESLPPLSMKSPCCVCFRGIPTLSGDDADDWKHQLFNFLIDGELVRMSLEEFFLAKGISVVRLFPSHVFLLAPQLDSANSYKEKILEIKYIKAVVPRNEEELSLHDDWVSVVDGLNPGFVLLPLFSLLETSDQILEEMKKFEVKPNGQTFICLLSAFVATGRLDRVYAID